MRLRTTGLRGHYLRAWLVTWTVIGIAASFPSRTLNASELRRTAIVEAVAKARASIVNIHGEKILDAAVGEPADARKRVNGMGTGVIVDSHGYVLTNHHVVDGVKRIMVTTAERETFIARLISHDPKTDLAIIKIDADRPLPTIAIGTSSDLLLGETVIAVGNAFGYEHTVTQGIISALNRTVQISDTQSYEDLIQTDASINPGNSGGPLLNIDGDMIGLNVAVRAGAQGIGFAIPADKVSLVANELLSTKRVTHAWHGVTARPAGSAIDSGVVIDAIEPDSPAAAAGFRVGDLVTSIGGAPIRVPLDIERAMIEQHSGDRVEWVVRRDQQPLPLSLVLADAPALAPVDSAWEALGMRLEPVNAKAFQQFRSRYRGGLLVTAISPDGPAAKQGIRPGDVLVGIHVWETVSLENVRYILSRNDLVDLNPVKFYILRGGDALFGHITAAVDRLQR